MQDDSQDARPARRFERLFTLRVWRENGGERTGALRGSIVEVGTERRFYFTELADLRDFLSLRLAASSPDGE
jgi:hypothetical protein